MAKCEVCGKGMVLYNNFDGTRICNACASIINLSAWVNRDCETLDDLKNLKMNALSAASNNKFPPDFIARIQCYFDSYIEVGYITTIHGKSGQDLKIFKDHCIIDTKGEAKRNTLMNEFYHFEPDDDDDDDNDNDDDSLFSSKDVGRFVHGFMTGGIIKTGINIATSAYVNSKEKEKEEERQRKIAAKKEKRKRRDRESVITTGERRVFFSEYKRVDSCNPDNSPIGCLKFIPIDSEHYLNCDYFFFKNSSAIPFEGKKIRARMAGIADMCNKRITELRLQREYLMQEEANRRRLEKEEADRITQLAQEENQKRALEMEQQQNAFAQIRKYKELWDEGIISEEEFTKKKKELLGL